MDLTPTAIQPIGPFYHFALTPGWETGDNSAGVMAGPEARGERVRLTIRLLDKDGNPVTNGMIELWQADAGGKYNHPADTQEKAADPAFRGFGRLATNDQGLCLFETVKPGPVPAMAPGLKDRFQAPHINVTVFAPGLLRPVVTRIYFEGDPANEADAVLRLVPEDRRPTLLARPGAEPGAWCFDLHLTGPCETVFFDV
jgi:protocatechuate 3,4-dioxygenase alpha subunit